MQNYISKFSIPAQFIEFLYSIHNILVAITTFEAGKKWERKKRVLE